MVCAGPFPSHVDDAIASWDSTCPKDVAFDHFKRDRVFDLIDRLTRLIALDRQRQLVDSWHEVQIWQVTRDCKALIL